MRKLIPVILLFFCVFQFDAGYSQSINDLVSDREFKSAMIRFYNREYQASIQLFNRALSMNPMNFKARYYLGYAYLNSGYEKSAVQEWESLIQLGGGTPQLKQKLNDIYFRMAIDKNYDYSESYILLRVFDGTIHGNHKVIRPSFIIYDPDRDTTLVSCADTKFVVEMDSAGKLIREFGRQFGDFSDFMMPTGIAMSGDRVYIADYMADTIRVYNRNGQYLSKFGSFGYGISNIAGPMGIYISEDDYLFVVDNGNDRIQKFDLDGNWIQSFGEGKLNRPTDIIGSGDNIFVSDAINHRIIHFDRFGNIIETIGEDTFKEPRGLALNADNLYVVDAKQGTFIYNLTRKSIEKLGVDESMFKMPFDLCLDSKKLIYQTDFNSYTIGIFIPLELRYANLGIQITQFYMKNYPHIYMSFRIWDKRGLPVYDLGPDNIVIYEMGNPVSNSVNDMIPFVQMGATYEHRRFMDVVFLIDKSVSMQQFAPELEETTKAFFEKMNGEDWMDIVLVNNETKNSGRINANLLWSWDYIRKNDYASPYPVELGTALYDATTSLFNVTRTKAIVLFTSGELGDGSFATYDDQIISTYARQNAIPIYVVAFTKKNEDLFRRIADFTFGKYYTMDNIKEILNLREEIYNSKPLEYIMRYDGLNLTGLSRFWVDVHLQVTYKGMRGVEDTGYFVPELIGPPVDVEKALTTTNVIPEGGGGE